MEKHYDLMYSESYDWWIFAVVSFYCMLDYSNAIDILDSSNNKYYTDNEGDELEDYLLQDRLFNLLSEIREQLMKGDYRVFDVFWHEYGEPLYSEEEIEEAGLPYSNIFEYDSFQSNLQYLSRIIRNV